MKISITKTMLASAIAAAALAHTSTALAQDVSSVDGFESVVIALKSNPLRDPEAACVALQIGMNLLMPLGDGAVDKVTLFPTLDGVEIVSDRMLPRGDLPNGKNKPYPAHLYCTTPSGEVPLPELLAGFAGMTGVEVVVCPLCWNARYEGEEPIYGDLGSADAIHNLFLYADKVIDF